MKGWALVAALALGLLAACDGGGGNPDEAEIRAVATNTFDYVKAERWGDVYDLMSSEFQARCSRDDFITAAEAALTPEQRQALASLKLVAVENIRIGENTAVASVVTEDGARSVTARFFAKEEGRWRAAPDPSTTGCNTEGG